MPWLSNPVLQSQGHRGSAEGQLAPLPTCSLQMGKGVWLHSELLLEAEGNQAWLPGAPDLKMGTPALSPLL